MKVIVTRPAAQAAEWVAQLAARGIDAVALSLIEIHAPADTSEVQACWHTLAGRALVVFVSPNAAKQFFALKPPEAAWPDAVVAGSTGPGTSHVLRAHGVPPACLVEPAADAPQFDSEVLWQQLRTRDWRGAQVTIVRGDGGRDWLARTLTEHGAQVSFVQAYRRAAPAADALLRAQLAGAIARPPQHLWFFSSSEAIDHLVALVPEAHWNTSNALATHPRIAARARDAGFAHVAECRPTLDAVVACIQSIDP